MDKKSGKNRSAKQSLKTELPYWKEKYESLDEKYGRMKTILKQVCSDLRNETEKTQVLKMQNDKLEKELHHKENLLERLQSVSEAVVDEYSILKTKCEMESEAAADAMKRATKENIILKHKSSPLLAQKTLAVIPGNLESPPLISEEEKEKIEKDIAEIELLQQTASSLRSEVANLKTQLRKEKEKQDALKDDVEIAKKLFEDEMVAHHETKEKIKALEQSLEQIKRVSELYVVKELEDLQVRYQKESEKVERISCEIVASLSLQVQKENSVLAHQQDVLLKSAVPDEQLSEALNKIEDLTAKLEDEMLQHKSDVEELQLKLKESENEESLNTTQEKLLCVEQCLEQAEQRAYTAERQVETLKHQIQELECSVQRLNAGLPPPAPPPPPPPPPSFNPLKSLITLISSGKKASTLAAVKKEAGNVQQQKAMCEMIDAIKKGSVHLRPTPKASVTPEKATDESAVGEMKEILSSLKKQKVGASSLQSTSSEPVCNELLEKLEKRRKISVSSEKLSTPLSNAEKDEEQSTIELRVVLKDKGTELILNDILRSSSSEDPGPHSGMVSASDSQTEGDSYACSPVCGTESPCPPVELRRKTQLSSGIDETSNICRGTFLVDNASAAVDSGVQHHDETSKVNDIVSDHSSSDSENSECDIFSDEEKQFDENAEQAVSGRHSDVIDGLLNVNLESENKMSSDSDTGASLPTNPESNSVVVEDTDLVTLKECSNSDKKNMKSRELETQISGVDETSDICRSTLVDTSVAVHSEDQNHDEINETSPSLGESPGQVNLISDPCSSEKTACCAVDENTHDVIADELLNVNLESENKMFSDLDTSAPLPTHPEGISVVIEDTAVATLKECCNSDQRNVKSRELETKVSGEVDETSDNCRGTLVDTSFAVHSEDQRHDETSPSLDESSGQVNLTNDPCASEKNMEVTPLGNTSMEVPKCELVTHELKDVSGGDHSVVLKVDDADVLPDSKVIEST